LKKKGKPQQKIEIKFIQKKKKTVRSELQEFY